MRRAILILAAALAAACVAEADELGATEQAVAAPPIHCDEDIDGTAFGCRADAIGSSRWAIEIVDLASRAHVLDFEVALAWPEPPICYDVCVGVGSHGLAERLAAAETAGWAP